MIAELVRRALLRMSRDGRFSPELTEAIRIHYDIPDEKEKMMENHRPQQGEAVTYVDGDGNQHNAICQYVWPNMGAEGVDGMNLVFLEGDAFAVQYRSSVGPFIEGVTPETGVEYWKPGTVDIVPAADEPATAEQPAEEAAEEEAEPASEEETETEAMPAGEAPEAEPAS